MDCISSDWLQCSGVLYFLWPIPYKPMNHSYAKLSLAYMQYRGKCIMENNLGLLCPGSGVLYLQLIDSTLNREKLRASYPELFKASVRYKKQAQKAYHSTWLIDQTRNLLHGAYVCIWNYTPTPAIELAKWKNNRKHIHLCYVYTTAQVLLLNIPPRLHMNNHTVPLTGLRDLPNAVIWNIFIPS